MDRPKGIPVSSTVGLIAITWAEFWVAFSFVVWEGWEVSASSLVSSYLLAAGQTFQFENQTVQVQQEARRRAEAPTRAPCSPKSFLTHSGEESVV